MCEICKYVYCMYYYVSGSMYKYMEAGEWPNFFPPFTKKMEKAELRPRCTWPRWEQRNYVGN